MSSTRLALLTLVLLLTAVRPSWGQLRPPHVASLTFPAAAPPAGDRDQNVGGSVLGAVIGGAAGGVTGILLALSVWDATRPGPSSGCHWQNCGYLGGLLLAWVGEAVGLGVGAHLGNGRRGNVIAPLAASLVVLFAAGVAGDNGRLPTRHQWVIPVLQIVAAVAAETAVGRDRARR